MSISEYKESIKKIVDATDNEALLKGWKNQLEHDTEPDNEADFTDAEWLLVQEGIEEYGKDETISFEDFIGKRK